MKQLKNILKSPFKYLKRDHKTPSNEQLLERSYGSGWQAFPMLDGLEGSANTRLFFRYYHLVSEVATAIDIISDSLLDIPVRLRNKKTLDIEDEADPLELFKRPNCIQSYRSFIKELATNFLISGNSFLRLTGDINKPPLEIFNVSPLDVSISSNMGGSIPLAYQVTNGSAVGLSEVFTANTNVRFEFDANCIRYFNKDMTAELVHIRDFNNGYSSLHRQFGVSKMEAAIKDIEQLVKANVFNISVLTRGANMSMAVKATEQMSREQIEAAKATIHNTWGGAERAGSIMMVPPGFDIEQMGKTPRDLEYAKLKEVVSKIIYNRYGIPLPLVEDKSMTFNNLSTARFMLYDFSVIPLARTIFEAFTLHILPRYKDLDDDLEFFVNLRDIDALEQRQIDKVKALSDIGVMTQNELRLEIGLEAMDDGNNIATRSPASSPTSNVVRHLNKEDLKMLTKEDVGIYGE